MRAKLVRIVFSFSLALATTSVLAGELAGLAKSVKSAPSFDSAAKLVLSNPVTQNDPELLRIIERVGDNKVDVRTSPRQSHQRQEMLATLIELKALTDNFRSDVEAAVTVKQIKSSPLYNDAGVAEGTNWLGRALDRLRNLKFKSDSPSFDPKPNPLFGRWIVYLLWSLLAGAIVFLLWLGLRHFEGKKFRSRKSRTLLEDDEPVRTIDEWLKEADELTAQGRLREAVRALYLACLLTFDEFRIARFDRRQTNWEHLRRIKSSPTLPPSIAFDEPTKAFDLIWYGNRINGLADVERFRSWYLTIRDSLRGQE